MVVDRQSSNFADLDAGYQPTTHWLAGIHCHHLTARSAEILLAIGAGRVRVGLNSSQSTTAAQSSCCAAGENQTLDIPFLV